MRTPAETIAFHSAVALSLLLVVSASLALAYLLSPSSATVLESLPDHPWWFVYKDPQKDGAGPLWGLGGALAGSLLAAAASLRSRARLMRTASPVLPFLLMFEFSLSLECLRAGSALLAVMDRSIPASIILTRAVLWGRFVGLLALLLAAINLLDMKYRRHFVLAGVVALVAFAMAAYIPIDRTVFLSQLTWKLGDEQGVWFVNLVIGILVLASIAGAALTRRDNRIIALGGGFALLILSRELLFFSLRPLLIGCGLVSLAGGIALCLAVLSRIYREAGT